VEILWRELQAFYLAASGAAPPPALAALPVQYADYAVWQRRWLAGAELARQMGYFRDGLGDDPAPLELPCDRPRPGGARRTGGLLRVPLDPGAAERVAALGAAERVTPFMLLLAVYAALLGRLSGQGGVSIGTPISGRSRGEL